MKKKKYFVVSDVHGFYTLLIKTLVDKGFDKDDPSHYLIICGDLFDRGNEAKEIFGFVKSLGERFVFIRGNHEDLLFDCVEDIKKGFSIDRNHFGNGTTDTVCQLCDLDRDTLHWIRTDELNKEICGKMQPILGWINKKSINYFEVGNYIFVHGWVPCVFDDLSVFKTEAKVRLAPRDWWDYENQFVWEEARWLNGMNAWRQGAYINGKTIVCGHWHCSYGWSHIRQKYKEYPRPEHEDFNKSFQPFVDKGIIAIDACTAYSGQMNCLVIEEE